MCADVSSCALLSGVGAVEVNERETEVGSAGLAQMRGGWSHYQLQGGPDDASEQVSTADGPVRQAEDGVNMDLGPVIGVGDVTEQAEDFALLVDLDAAVLLVLAVEPAVERHLR